MKEPLSFKEMEQMLAKYKWYLKESKLIELSIRYPVTEHDDNVGGGKSSSSSDDSMLRTIIKLEDNEELDRYVRIGRAIENTYAELPADEQKAMMEFYVNRHGAFRGHAKRTAAKLGIDPSTLYRWRLNIVKAFEKNLEKY